VIASNIDECEAQAVVMAMSEAKFHGHSAAIRDLLKQGSG
jgi:hypothetical protein